MDKKPPKTDDPVFILVNEHDIHGNSIPRWILGCIFTGEDNKFEAVDLQDALDSYLCPDTVLTWREIPWPEIPYEYDTKVKLPDPPSMDTLSEISKGITSNAVAILYTIEKD